MQISGTFLKWIIESKGDRFYQILRTLPLDRKQDLSVRISGEETSISSLALGRSIFFTTSELLAEYEKQAKPKL